MDTKSLMGVVLAAGLMSGGIALADGFSADSKIGALLDKPEAKEVLLKHIPDLVNSSRIERARGVSLSSIRKFVPGLDEAKLKQINEDLAKIK